GVPRPETHQDQQAGERHGRPDDRRPTAHAPVTRPRGQHGHLTFAPTPYPVSVGLAPLDSPGRNETHLERCDRNLVELIQEVRVMQTGVQVMFAFLLTAPLAPRFDTLTSSQRAGYFVTLLAAGAATVLLIAPTAYHRILFRLGDKEHVVLVANRLALAGLGC